MHAGTDHHTCARWQDAGSGLSSEGPASPLAASPCPPKNPTPMKHDAPTFQKGFRVGEGNARSQCAVMVLAKGGCEGGSNNRHRGADQWLVVFSGTGVAIVNGHKIPLRAGSTLLIERGDTHEIRNTGRGLLKTVSIYVPPAYKPDGDELPAGKR